MSSSSKPRSTPSQASHKKRKYSGRSNQSTSSKGRGGSGGQSNNNNSNNFRSHNHYNPKRGGPGILLTCETTREVKCQREGLEILNYYLQSMQESDEQASSAPDKKDSISNAPLSLEEELKQLQSKSSTENDAKSSSAFAVYNTGCRGSVMVVCTLPGCELIDPIQTEYKKAKLLEQEGGQTKGDDDDKEQDGKETNEPNKKPKTEESNDQRSPPTTGTSETELVWDPVATVDAILADRVSKKNIAAPSSRFVTRVIPIQATCFASEEELRLTCQQLLPKYLPRDTKSFAIVMKRRNCQGLKRDQVIDTIATIVLELVPNCKVQLDQPDITIMVEICRTLCGVSVLKNYHQYKNFNLFSNEEKAAESKKSSS
jgi:tRNA acetyltransferase TAN1